MRMMVEDMYIHEYKMTCVKTGKVIIEKSKLFQYDYVKQYYPDITAGQNFSSMSNRFYSPKDGYILLECKNII